MESRSKHIISEIKIYIVITIGMCFYAFAWTSILNPAEVVGGGIPGVGQLIYLATGGANGGIPMYVSYFVINVVLIGAGIIIIGPRFGAKTIYAMCANTVLMAVMEQSIPADLLGLASDKLLSAILGGALCGLGIGICFSQGGSTGGTDIIAMIINKYHNVSLGRVIMLCDVVIVGSSVFIFGNITSIVYGYITLGLTGFTIDAFLQGNRQSCQLMVISRKYEDISDRIVKDARRGVTLLDGQGWFTKQPQKVVLVFCRRNEVTDIYRIIKEVDSSAFITNSAISGIYGNGFENIKSVKTESKKKLF